MALSRRRLVTFQEPVVQQVVTREEELMKEVNKEEISLLIAKLHLIATRPLSLLTAEQCADLETIRKLSRLVYGTPAYSVLHDKVKRIFVPAPVHNTAGVLFSLPVVYQPHTVGAFFVGCITPSNLTEVTPDINAGCSLLCADALPPAGDKTWGFCSQNVVWCVLSSSSVARNASNPVVSPGLIDIDHSQSSKYDFIYITKILSSSKAILFIDCNSYDDFPGFTRHEKARLIHRMRITDVKLLSYERDDSGGKMAYKDLIGKVTKVVNLKSRADVRDNETSAQRTARRAQSSSKLLPLAESNPPFTWQQAATMAFILLVVVILGVSSALVISSLRSSSASVINNSRRTSKPPRR